jgi:hypothetical protein
MPVDLPQQLALVPAPPRFWRDETSGVLAEAVHAYLTDRALTPNQIRYLRLYCVQWIGSPVWDANPSGASAELAALRESAKEIHSIQQLDRWIGDAVDIGMDPL